MLTLQSNESYSPILTFFSVLITGVLRVIYGYKPGSTNISFEKGEMWSAVHVGTAVICACLPTLRPLFMIGARAILCNRARGYGSGSRTGSARDNTWYHRKSRSARQSVSARSKDATRKSGDKYSQKGIMTLIGDQESLKPTASDDIIVEERMDTEWSRSPSGAGSHDDIGLVQVEKAHIRR